MKEFTFIVITYNQEQYVVEHLNSIKNLIELYGKDMSIDLVHADDKSRDGTVEVVRKWLDQNRDLFRNVTVIEREKNVGTIRNIKSAIEATKTEQFKFLAGDDKYNGEKNEMLSKSMGKLVRVSLSSLKAQNPRKVQISVVGKIVEK